MDASVSWVNNMKFTGRTPESGLSLELDANAEVGGAGEGFRPMELMLLSLAGCTGMDVISILQKKRQPVERFEVLVHGERAEDHPRVFTHLTVTYRLHGKGIDPAAVERAIELSSTKYCPAQAMLSRGATIDHAYTIEESPAPGDAAA
jgi:putative redox protein